MIAALVFTALVTSDAFIPKPKIWNPLPGAAPLKVRRIQSKDLPPQGYELRIRPGGVILAARDEAGFRYGAMRLHRLAENGRVPCGTMRDWPTVAWRGVHLFVGPTALQFHKKLWAKVLLPLGFNKVVLECERTEWRCLPKLRGGIHMKRADLAKLCEWYRAHGVEVIPLVQSFGHMGWLFDDPAQRTLALNPSAPFALDPRKPGAAKLLRRLWSEVIQVTKAKTVHFGMDEITMRGWTGDAALLRTLWHDEWANLRPILARRHVRAMLWGDMGLAKGQGVDYCHAPDGATAAAMRAEVPAGSLIGDWHYSGKRDPNLFRTSLQLWKRAGCTPIATTWSNPFNVRSFAVAATLEGCGTLQTTWAGYESTERAIPRNLDQFGAMVVASEYAWGGRSELPAELGYSPNQAFLRLFNR